MDVEAAVVAITTDLTVVDTTMVGVAGMDTISHVGATGAVVVSTMDVEDTEDPVASIQQHLLSSLPTCLQVLSLPLVSPLLRLA